MTWEIKKATLIALLCLTCVTAVSLYQTFLLRQQTKMLEDRISATSEEFDGHMEDIYFLMKSDSSKLYTIMDTEVRILHYAKPHKHPMWACPECAEQKDREKLDEKLQNKSGHNHGSAGAKKDGHK